MYSFEPTGEQKMLIETVSRYARLDLRPAARQADESGSLPPAVIEKGWELGLLQASIPAAYGGFGERSTVTGVLATEEMAFGDLAGAMAVAAPGLFALPILLAGSEDQKKLFLPAVIAGGWTPHSAALIEYSFDFDPNDLKATARAEAGDFVLNGEKALVPFAREAETLLIFAAVDGCTQGFIVPKESPGLQVLEERESLLGLNALPLYRIKLGGVRVPGSARLGGASGHDFGPVLASMRLAAAAGALGLARAAFEYARGYALEREAFGVKIAQKQAVAFMLAEMATEIDAMRMLTWEAAWSLDAGKPSACTGAYLAATGASDMAMMVTDRAVQILGGHGYIREHPVEMWMRNGRSFAALTGLAMV